MHATRLFIAADEAIDAYPVERIDTLTMTKDMFQFSFRGKKPVILSESCKEWFQTCSTVHKVPYDLCEYIASTVSDSASEVLFANDGRNFLKNGLCFSKDTVDLKVAIRSIFRLNDSASINNDLFDNKISSNIKFASVCSLGYNYPLHGIRSYVRLYMDSHPHIRQEVDLSYLESFACLRTINQFAPTEKFKHMNSSGEVVSCFKDESIGLWISSEGCVTPLHFDICHGFLAQIVGQKTFIMCSADDNVLNYYWRRKSVSDKNGCTSPIDFYKWLLADVEERKKYPLLDEIGWFIATLSPGDILYTPPGWWHFVVSETISVSVLVPFDPIPGLETLPANVCAVAANRE